MHVFTVENNTEDPDPTIWGPKSPKQAGSEDDRLARENKNYLAVPLVAEEDLTNTEYDTFTLLSDYIMSLKVGVYA